MQWILKQPLLCVVAFVDTSTSDLFDIGRAQLLSTFTYTRRHGPWHLCSTCISGRTFLLAWYRYRVLILHNPPLTGPIGTDTFIRDTFLPIAATDLPTIDEMIKNTIGAQFKQVYRYPIVVSRSFAVRRTKPLPVDHLPLPPWLDDSTTTHYCRIYDSTRLTPGYLRVSKWLTISYGLNNNINRELINLVYEKILHPMRRRGALLPQMGEDELALLDALSRRTGPIEFGLFIQRVALKAPIFLAMIIVSIALVQYLSPLSSPLFILLSLAFLAAAAGAFWLATNALLRQPESRP